MTKTPSGIQRRGFPEPRHVERTERDRREPGPGSLGPQATERPPSPAASLGICDAGTRLEGRSWRHSGPPVLGDETDYKERGRE